MQKPVFLLLDSRQFGGIESHVLELAKGLKAAGVGVHVVLLQDYGQRHSLEEALKQGLIHCHKLSSPISSLIGLIARYQPCLLHTHGYKAGIIGRLLGLCYRVPVVSSFHAGEAATGKLAIYDFIDRYSACLAKQRIAVSPIIAARLPFSSHVVNNFLSRIQPTLSQGKQIAFVGRLSHEKGADRFVGLAQTMPEHTFHVYGDGPDAARLTASAGTNVQFHGQQQMDAIWPQIGLLVMPSRYEGLPMAAVEAMAHGIPVLAYNVGALDKLIDDRLNGYLVKAGEQSALLKALQDFLQLPMTSRQEMQTAAQTKIQANFSAQAILPTVLQLYQRALC
ncbi:glycosyltransferase family 4 protein [Motilimonas sp. KMU-193]|uniref:glycosyltransferase family 4 protein n=1 Tax=Motilimonas sp. KMU-193 TaxID=3388668 RepID=UPI00396B390A